MGERLTTGDEIAREYGVSRPTADKAVGNLAARGYVERVQGRGSFVRDWRGQTSDNRQADGISIICTNEDIGFYGSFLHDASREAEKNGYCLTFSSMGGPDDCFVPLVIRKKQTVGTLVVGALSDHQAEVLLGSDLPHLFVGNHRCMFGKPAVRYDLTDAGYQITRKLIELGRGQVWLEVGPTISTYYSQELLDGYQRAVMEDANARHHVLVAKGEDDGDFDALARSIAASSPEQFCMIGGYEYTSRLLEGFKRIGVDMAITAVVYRNMIEGNLPNTDFMSVCDISLAGLAAEGVRQIIANAQSGDDVTGKSYKLEIETVDDQTKPLRFSWR